MVAATVVAAAVEAPVGAEVWKAAEAVGAEAVAGSWAEAVKAVVAVEAVKAAAAAPQRRGRIFAAGRAKETVAAGSR